MTRTILPKQVTSKSSETTTFESLDTSLFGDNDWIKDYKEFVHDYIPEGWFFKMRIGYVDVVTNSNRSALDMGLSLEKTWSNVHDFFMYGFYNYAKEYYSNNKNTNISVDKYGAGASYAYKFLGADSGFFCDDCNRL